MRGCILEKSPCIVYIAESKPPRLENLLYVSPNLKTILGWTKEEIYPNWWVDNLHPEDREKALQNVEKLKREGEIYHVYRFRKRDGSYAWIKAYGKVIEKIRDIYKIVGYWTDVTELKEQTDLFETLTQNAPVAIFLYREKFLYANPAGLELTGYSLKELKEKFVWDLVPEKHKDGVKEIIRRRINCEKILKEYTDFEVIRKDGEKRIVRLYADTVKYKGGCAGLAVGIDITKQKELEAELLKITFYDPLTGLPNRLFFLEELKSYINLAARRKEYLAVIVLDLNRFRYVNASYGTKAGDAVLREVARRLKRILRESDIVGRFFADEFGIIVGGLRRKKDITVVVNKIRSIFDQPFTVNTHTVHLNANYGVSVYPTDGENAQDLLRKAELALRTSKEVGEGAVYFYSKDIEKETVEEAILRISLKDALERGEFILYYQPIFRLYDRKIIGVEALLRWQHPELGLISPVRFIPIAENTGLIVKLGYFVLDKALEDISKIRKKGYDLFVGINFSARQFSDEKLLSKIEKTLKKHRVKGGNLLFEITESTAMRDPEKSKEILRNLKDMGIKIAIDDFGTGYSSMNYLIEFDIDKIKIDKSFVLAMMEKERAKSVVKTIIDLSHSIGAVALAEGIETEEQLRELVNLDCDEGQGYLISPPVDYNRLMELLESYGGTAEGGSR